MTGEQHPNKACSDDTARNISDSVASFQDLKNTQLICGYQISQLYRSQILCLGSVSNLAATEPM